MTNTVLNISIHARSLQGYLIEEGVRACVSDS